MAAEVFLTEEQEKVLRSFPQRPHAVSSDPRTGIMWCRWWSRSGDRSDHFYHQDGRRVEWVEAHVSDPV